MNRPISLQTRSPRLALLAQTEERCVALVLDINTNYKSRKYSANTLAQFFSYSDEEILSIWPGFSQVIKERSSKHYLGPPSDFGWVFCHRCDQTFEGDDPEETECTLST